MDKSENKAEGKNKYQNAFSKIFDIKEEGKKGDVLEILQFLVLLKPENCNVFLEKAEFEEYINLVKINTFYQACSSLEINLLSKEIDTQVV